MLDLETLIMEKTRTGPATVSEIVGDVTRGSVGKRDQVVAEIIRLRAEGKILIGEPVPYATLVQYLSSPASVWLWEMLLATLSTLGLVLVSSASLTYARYVFGGFLVLFLPGYSFVSLLYPEDEGLEPLTRASLSFAMSLAIVMLVGLVLSYSPFGITLIAVASSLSSIVIGFSLLTTIKRYSSYKLVKRSSTV